MSKNNSPPKSPPPTHTKNHARQSQSYSLRSSWVILSSPFLCPLPQTCPVISRQAVTQGSEIVCARPAWGQRLVSEIVYFLFCAAQCGGRSGTLESCVGLCPPHRSLPFSRRRCPRGQEDKTGRAKMEEVVPTAYSLICRVVPDSTLTSRDFRRHIYSELPTLAIN